MTRVLELFGRSTAKKASWPRLVVSQPCPFTDTKCIKIRKSDPNTSIGTCTVAPGQKQLPLVICPKRFLEHQRIFRDAVHLLLQHEPGNDIHVVPETAVPGGSVDYFLVSARKGRVVDFVGIEVQALDTTGTVWPERERFLAGKGLPHDRAAAKSDSPFGVNWKMTAKTTLVQLHHKVGTFEHLGKKLVLACQDLLYDYMAKEFKFEHLAKSARAGDAMHFHCYSMDRKGDGCLLDLRMRLSTDAEGVAKCLGLQGETKVELEVLLEQLQAAISPLNLLHP